MKSIIYFDGSKEKKYYDINSKLNLDKYIKKKLNEKIIIKNIKNIMNTFDDELYEIIINSNYKKILIWIIIEICNNYIQKCNTKPHCIISYYETSFIKSLFKKLLKLELIESITIIQNVHIIEDVKKYKQNNTLFVCVSTINNNIIYNLKSLQSFCKYYNLLLISNDENIIYNYIYENNELQITNYINKYYICNQDIIYLHKNIILLKKKLLKKYNLSNNAIISNEYSKSNLANLLNLISFNNNYNKNYNYIQKNYFYFLNELKQHYKIINYENFINIKNIYFQNTFTIIYFANTIDRISLNNILISIYAPNYKFNNNIIEYLKKNNIILNTNYNISQNIPKILINNLLNIKLSQFTKQYEINKLIKLIVTFINNSNIPDKKKNKKKKISFTTPEFNILTKPYKSNNYKNIKSILKR